MTLRPALFLALLGFLGSPFPRGTADESGAPAETPAGQEAAPEAPPGKEEEKPTYTVGKFVKGDDVTFEVFETKQYFVEKSRRLKEAKEELAKWEADKAAFLADKENRGFKYLELKPEYPNINIARDRFPTEEEARQYAQEKQQKAEGKFAVVSILGTDGFASVEVMSQKKIRAKEQSLKEEYQKSKQKWEAAKKAHYLIPAWIGCRQWAFEHGQPDCHPFTAPQPVIPKLTRLKTDLESREAAEKAAEELKKAQ